MTRKLPVLMALLFLIAPLSHAQRSGEYPFRCVREGYPEDPSLFDPRANLTVALENRNDDILYGVIRTEESEIREDGSHDFGNTNDFFLRITKKIARSGVLSIVLADRLYTQVAKRRGRIEEGLYLQAFGWADDMKVIGFESTDNFKNQFIDESSLKIDYQHGKKIYVRGGLGIARRQVEMNSKNGPLGVSVQKAWHRLWQKKAGMYQHDHLSAEGMEGSVELVHTPQGRIAVVEEGYYQNEVAQSVSRFSFLFSAAIGGRQQFFRGRCEIQSEAGVNISTEDNPENKRRKVLGQNTYAYAGGELRVRAIRRQDESDPDKSSERVMLGTGLEVQYFPVSSKKQITGEASKSDPKMGAAWTSRISTVHYVGKNGNSVEPYYILIVPGGRQQFQQMNDVNLTQAVGVRFNFR